MTQDRIKNSVLALMRTATPRIDTLALYRGKVVGQAGGTVDVKPDDQRLPPMSAVPLRHGLPGTAVQVAPGTSILVGWSGGDPSAPYACLWDGGETVTKLTLGGANAVDAVVKGTTYRTAQQAFDAKLTSIAAQLTTAGADPVFAALCSTAASAIASAGALLTAAVLAFDPPGLPADPYLSQIVKVQ